MGGDGGGFMWWCGGAEGRYRWIVYTESLRWGARADRHVRLYYIISHHISYHIPAPLTLSNLKFPCAYPTTNCMRGVMELSLLSFFPSSSSSASRERTEVEKLIMIIQDYTAPEDSTPISASPRSPSSCSCSRAAKI